MTLATEWNGMQCDLPAGDTPDTNTLGEMGWKMENDQTKLRKTKYCSI